MEQTKTNYKEFFSKLQELGNSTFVLRGGTLVVELLADEELKSKGGIILAVPDAHKRNSIAENKIKAGRVVAVGEGYVGDDGERIPCDVNVGAIVLLPPYAPQYVSVFPGIAEPTQDRLALIKEDQILAYYTSEEAYEQAKTLSST